jgi:predicted phage baseplate assembly protein
MTIPVPTLDDRTFEDLFEQARSLIPRYAPEWTDHNESDPGIAMLQLHAFFADQLIYRLNQVPDLNYLKFLALLGIDVKPASPARVDVTFTTSSPAADAIVPAGTQIATASGGSGGPPVVFSLPEALNVVAATLSAVQVFDTFSYRDVTTANIATGQGIDPFGPNAHVGSALMLGFAAPGPFTDQPLTVMVYPEQPLAVPVLEAQLDIAPVPPPATFAYEYWDGAVWQPLQRLTDGTWALLRTGAIVVAAPAGRPAKAKLGAVTASLYWLRLRLMTATFDQIPRIVSLAPNTATAIQAITFTDEVLGGSDGMPGQGPFTLSTTPVVTLDTPYTVRRSDGTVVSVISLELTVDEGSGPDPWQEVSDFLASGPDDPHYILDHAAGQITFGDGRRGRIPSVNPALPTVNIVAARYQAGGGARGNVGAATVTVLQTLAPGIASVTNALPASGGADQETIADAKLRAPSVLKSQGRAVTAEDFETVTLATPAPVARAHAEPLTHPAYPGVSVPGAVTVVVVPQTTDPAPRPNEATLELVCRQLNAARLITTEVFATGPTYRKVKVTGQVVVATTADLATVEQAVAAAITGWLHPLTGGDTGTGWPFGGTIYISSLYRVVLGVRGVTRIKDNQMLVVLDGMTQTFCRDVDLNPGELIEPLAPDLVVTYS